MQHRNYLIGAAILAASLGTATGASDQSIVALSSNTLLTFVDAKSMKTTATVKINGGNVIGIDVRPADGLMSVRLTECFTASPTMAGS